MSYAFWADVIVTIHVAYVGFVVVGELIILLGWMLGWSWVRNPWFRLVHLLAILFVAYEAFWQMTCPLTTWEWTLREWANQPVEHASFTGWLFHKILFYEGADEAMFRKIHQGFGVLVFATLFLVWPRWKDLRGKRTSQLSSSGLKAAS